MSQRRLVRLYRDSLWGATCGLASHQLLWCGGAHRPPLAACGAPAALEWLRQALEYSSGQSRVGCEGLAVCVVHSGFYSTRSV